MFLVRLTLLVSFVSLLSLQTTALAQSETKQDRFLLPASKSAVKARTKRNGALSKAAKAFQKAKLKATKEYYVALEDALGKAKKAKNLPEAQRIMAEMTIVKQEVTFMTASQVYLADVKASGSHVGYGKLGLNGDLGHANRSVIVNGTKAKHSISTHAVADGEAYVSYVIPPQFTKFTGAAAICDSATQPPLKTVLSVEGDGRVLWRSPVLIKGKPIPFDVDLTGVSNLRLVVTCDGLAGGGHTVWLEPVLSQ